MSRISGLCVVALLSCAPTLTSCAPTFNAAAADAPVWPAALPKYDHIVIVVEENKDYDQIIGNKNAPYINMLAAEGANLIRMFGEEHFSQGNYFWLFSGSNQNVGFFDQVPQTKFTASNLGQQLIMKGLSFKGYSQSLPVIGSEIDATPPNCRHSCLYGRKHVPWISFANVPNGTTVETSSNLRFADFPSDYSKLPTVAFVIPDLEHDMHNGMPKDSVPAGDLWLKQNLDPYYQWAKTHNSLLIVTFDENDDKTGIAGLTDPAINPDHDQSRHDRQNRIATIIAGAYVKPNYAEPNGITHVNILRTIEAMYGLPKSGAQQPNALRAGISDDATVADVFMPVQ
jgi:phosphatidylinositol-3-phosphatase